MDVSGLAVSQPFFGYFMGGTSEIVRDRSTAVAAAALLVATGLAWIGLAGYDAPMMASASWWRIGCCVGLMAVLVLAASMSLL